MVVVSVQVGRRTTRSITAIADATLKLARGEHLLLLNNDTRMLTAQWDDILRGLLEREDVLAVGARLLYEDMTIQHAGVLTGGMFSVAVVRVMGAAFMALGLAAVVSPADSHTAWLAAGFGGLQCVFGLYIARNHGG